MMPMRRKAGSMECEAEIAKSDAWRGYKDLPRWLIKRAVIRFFPAKPYRRWNGENVHLSVDMPPILPRLEKLGSWGKSEIRSPGLTLPLRPVIGMRGRTTRRSGAGWGWQK